MPKIQLFSLFLLLVCRDPVSGTFYKIAFLKNGQCGSSYMVCDEGGLREKVMCDKIHCGENTIKYKVKHHLFPQCKCDICIPSSIIDRNGGIPF